MWTPSSYITGMRSCYTGALMEYQRQLEISANSDGRSATYPSFRYFHSACLIKFYKLVILLINFVHAVLLLGKSAADIYRRTFLMDRGRVPLMILSLLRTTFHLRDRHHR